MSSPLTGWRSYFDEHYNSFCASPLNYSFSCAQSLGNWAYDEVMSLKDSAMHLASVSHSLAGMMGDGLLEIDPYYRKYESPFKSANDVLRTCGALFDIGLVTSVGMIVKKMEKFAIKPNFLPTNLSFKEVVEVNTNELHKPIRYAFEKYFAGKTMDEIKLLLTKKFGPSRGGYEGGAAFYNERTRRSFHVHKHVDHANGRAHIDVKKRGFKKKYFYLKE